MELFFDLVFVFAVTQLSHYLLDHHTLAGALQTLVMFLAVWWAWIYTAWATNWLDPERAPVRLELIVVMLLSLVLSSAIPGAFGDYGLPFALAYVAIQVGRTIYTAWAKGEWHAGGFEEHGPGQRLFRRFGRAVDRRRARPRPACGGSPGGSAALILEYSGTAFFFFVPGIGRSTVGGMGHQRRAYGRALLAVHHHLARRGHIGDRRDLRRAGAGRCRRSSPS